ncbi:MAG TPA: hypothetical protein VFH73_08340 [Polyangia bacterium]|nr:hypothetical protein [Polyangia bacterium]
MTGSVGNPGAGGSGHDAAVSTGGVGLPGDGTGGAAAVDTGSPPASGGTAGRGDGSMADVEPSGFDASPPVGAAAGYGLAGPSRCAGAGVAVCESFENGLDATIWRTSASGGATAVVDEMHAARGTKALHVHSGGGGNAYITERSSFPATSANLYARMYVYLEDDITTSGHFSMAEGAGTGTGARIRFGGQFKNFGVGTDGGSSGDWTDRDNKVVPSKQWMCIEFQFKGDTSEFRVWWDDAERTALHVGPSRHGGFTMPTFNSLWFGWWMYNASEPQDMWIDEIAIDSKPIGCAK